MSPYFTVFYSPVIQRQLRAVAPMLAAYGYLNAAPDALDGRALAEAVAEGFLNFNRAIHAPERLTQLPGFSERYVTQIMAAAKDPSLSVKLKSMPVPLTAEEADTYMLPVVRAAMDGNLAQILTKQ